MLRTPLCDLLGIDVPIVQASLGPWTSVQLAAAACEAGILGTIGTALRSPAQLREDVARLRELTDGPFAINHTVRPFDEELFRVTLDARPAVVSLAHGDPNELVARVHDAGAVFVQQVNTVAQAVRAAEQGVDAIIAQGTESAGFAGGISTIALVPQVVDAVDEVPVLAAGGIADGRGLAAALVLGAQGANVGTRFLASEEAEVPEVWKRRIVDAASEDAVKAAFAEFVFPPGDRPGGYTATPRVLRTPFVDEWNARLDDARREGERIGRELAASVADGRAHELIPFTGQSAGAIREVLPVAEIVRRFVAGTEEALARVARARA